MQYAMLIGPFQDNIWMDQSASLILGYSAAATTLLKSLVSSVISVKVVMKMCFDKNLVVFARVLQTIRQIYFFIAILFSRFKLRPMLHVFYIRLSYESRDSFFCKGLYLVWSDTQHLCFLFETFILLNSRFEHFCSHTFSNKKTQ